MSDPATANELHALRATVLLATGLLGLVIAITARVDIEPRIVAYLVSAVPVGLGIASYAKLRPRSVGKALIAIGAISMVAVLPISAAVVGMALWAVVLMAAAALVVGLVLLFPVGQRDPPATGEEEEVAQ